MVGSWTNNTIKDQNVFSVLTSVRKTALALYNQSPKPNITEQQLFKNVINKQSLIGFVFYARPQRLTCQTHNLIVPNAAVNPPVNLSQAVVSLITAYIDPQSLISHFETQTHQALIECDVNFGANFTEYTSTHELGHALEGATGGTSSTVTNSLYNLIRRPYYPSSDALALYDSSSLAPLPLVYSHLVYGYFTNVDPSTGVTDYWTRGVRGWGSSSDLKSSMTACDFQQNPLEFIGQAQPSEIDEAAADMFLNWVYRKLDAPNANPPSGFKNVNWASSSGCQLNGTPDLGFSGISRNQLMSTIMSTLVP